MRNGSGIYKIENAITGDCYVGSTVDFNSRGNKHFSYLMKGKHENFLLQDAYNRYGSGVFEFYVLLYCEPVELLRYEQFFIDTQKSKYNLSPTAGSIKGYNKEAFLKKRRKLTRKHVFMEMLGPSICLGCKRPFPPRANGSTWFYCASCIRKRDYEPKFSHEACRQRIAQSTNLDLLYFFVNADFASKEELEI